jgi:hypothetical protein
MIDDEMDIWIWPQNRAGIKFGRIDCGSLVFSRARVRADDFDWDLER